MELTVGVACRSGKAPLHLTSSDINSTNYFNEGGKKYTHTYLINYNQSFNFDQSKETVSAGQSRNFPLAMLDKNTFNTSYFPRVLLLWINPWRPGSSNVCSVGRPSSTNTTSKSISASTAVRQSDTRTVTHQFAISSSTATFT